MGYQNLKVSYLLHPLRKDKKAGLLVSHKDVTVLSPVDNEPTFQPTSGASAQPSAAWSS